MNTTTVPSQFSPADLVGGPCLFAVNAGHPVQDALDNAHCLLAAVVHMTHRGQLDSHDTYVAEFLSRAAMGLLESVGVMP